MCEGIQAIVIYNKPAFVLVLFFQISYTLGPKLKICRQKFPEAAIVIKGSRRRRLMRQKVPKGRVRKIQSPFLLLVLLRNTLYILFQTACHSKVSIEITFKFFDMLSIPKNQME